MGGRGSATGYRAWTSRPSTFAALPPAIWASGSRRLAVGCQDELAELNQKLSMSTDPLHGRVDTERRGRRYRRKARSQRSG